MNENKLLASVVLFRELYDEGRDIYDVIGALLKAAITIEKKWAFNTTEATQLLETTFGFSIPEAVVRTTLRNRLKNKENILSFDNGVYSLVENGLEEPRELSAELKKVQDNQSGIFQDLIKYVLEYSATPIKEAEYPEVINSFSGYLFDNETSGKFSNLISSFIIDSQNQPGFKDALNAVREGFVLYNGIRYSPDLNDLGAWKNKLTIYLDTEHLFNAAGYNGQLFKQLFDDFYRLVKEINSAGRKYITLKYFQECKDEIENFFYVAELISEGKQSLNPSKSAMVEILKDSQSRADILEKKALLYSALEKKRIKLEEQDNFHEEPQFVVEGQNVLDELREKANKQGRPFDEDKCAHVLKLFTKINCLRKGENSKAFEEIGYVLMSGRSYTHYLAFNPSIRESERDIPFATDLEFLTNRFWFRLKKGLGDDAYLPKSLDVVAKAQVVLSSQINNSVSEKYDSIKERLNKGTITRQDAEYIHHELRGKAAYPEEITPETVKDKLAFLSHDDYEVHLREKSALERRAIEGDEAKERLAQIEKDKSDKRKGKAISKAKTERVVSWVFLIAFILFFIGLVIYFVYLLRIDSDSPLTVAGIIISVMVSFFTFLKIKKVKRFLDGRYEQKVKDASM